MESSHGVGIRTHTRFYTANKCVSSVIYNKNKQDNLLSNPHRDIDVSIASICFSACKCTIKVQHIEIRRKRNRRKGFILFEGAKITREGLDDYTYIDKCASQVKSNDECCKAAFEHRIYRYR